MAKINNDLPVGVERTVFGSLEQWADHIVSQMKHEANNKKEIEKHFIKYAIHIPHYIEKEYPDLYPPIKKKLDDREKQRQKRLEKQNEKNGQTDIGQKLDQLRSEKGKSIKVGFFLMAKGNNKHDQIEYRSLQNEGADFVMATTKKGLDTYNKEKSELLNGLKSGDTLIVFQLSHIVASIPHLITLVETFHQRNIHLKSLSESWMDTSSSKQFTTETFFKGLSELSKDLKVDKKDEAIQKALDNGQKLGRNLKANADVSRAVEMYKNNIHNYTITKICEINNISRSTLWRRLRDLDLL